MVGAGKGRFSIADISLLGWANIALFSGVDIQTMFPNVVAWIERCQERQGVRRGMSIPVPWDASNKTLAEKIKEDPETRQKHEELKKHLDNAKTQYGYKYASP